MRPEETSQSAITYNPQQWTDPDKFVHEGEILNVHAGMGYTGYLEWNVGYLSQQNVNCARLFAVDGYGMDLWVAEEERRKGIGEILLTAVTRRVKEKGFECFVVVGVTGNAKGFYDKVFAALQEQGDITSTQVTPRYSNGYRDYVYVVSLAESVPQLA